MPHVVSQMQPRERPQQTPHSKRTMMKNAISQDNLRSSTTPRRRNANGPTPTLSLLVTPQGAWNYIPGRQHSKQFSPDRMTPISAVDSVFELSSAATNASPNSATSSFIAELEDTSPGAVKPQKINMDPKSPLSPTRSVSPLLKVYLIVSILIHILSYMQLLPLKLLMTSRQRISVFLSGLLRLKMQQRY